MQLGAPMRFRSSARLASFAPLAVAGVTLVACAGAHDEGPAPDVAEASSELGSRVGVDQLSTFEPAVSLLDGYEATLDARLTKCVDQVGDRAPLVGQVVQQTTIQLVKNEQELTRDLGVDASVTLKIPFGNVAGTLGIVRSFKESREHVNYLIQSVQSYRVTNLAPVALTPAARDMLDASPSLFFTLCGDRYITDVTYQAKIVALLTFETASEESARTLKGELGANLELGPINADTSIKTQLSNLAKRTDVTARMNVVAQGFDVSADDGVLGISGNVEEKLARMDAVTAKLAASLRADRDRDAQGYATVTLRNAIPAAVGLARYGYATNAPAALEASEAFRTRRDKQRSAERFLRAFAGLESSMDRAYSDEIFPLLVADAEAERQYNVVPPAAPKRFAEEMRRVAEEWSGRFEPDADGTRRSDRRPVQDALAACAEDIRFGTYEACSLDKDPATLPTYVGARAALDEYQRRGRIAKVRTTAASATEVPYPQAVELCQRSNGRLPTVEEANVLAPLVAGTAGGVNRTVWTAAAPNCDPSSGGFPTFVNTSLNNGARCQSRSLFGEVRAAVFCVPQAGPLPKASLL